jgi:hypothetical protein
LRCPVFNSIVDHPPPARTAGKLARIQRDNCLSRGLGHCPGSLVAPRRSAVGERQSYSGRIDAKENREGSPGFPIPRQLKLGPLDSGSSRPPLDRFEESQIRPGFEDPLRAPEGGPFPLNSGSQRRQGQLSPVSRLAGASQGKRGQGGHQGESRGSGHATGSATAHTSASPRSDMPSPGWPTRSAWQCLRSWPPSPARSSGARPLPASA